ncbi:MAG: hypothetical protein P4L84_07485 [Isosphaeraceae bacterium]|nr:hypothetical protein [Isosphaeraceae bacterium]
MDEPLSQNHFIYTSDAPTNLVDPTGHDENLPSVSVGTSSIGTFAANMTVRIANIFAKAQRIKAASLAGVTSLWSRFGELIERIFDRTVALFNGPVQILRYNVPTMVKGTIDRLIQINNRAYFVEIKSSINKYSEGFPRVVTQFQRALTVMQNGVVKADQFVVWSARAVDLGTHRALQTQLGPDAYNKIQFVEGVPGLINWIKMMMKL